MSYRTILVHADGGPEVEGRLRFAAGIAAELGARLVGAAARLPTPLVELHTRGVSLLSVGVTGTSGSVDDTEFREVEAIFGRAMRNTGIEASWRAAIDYPSAALASMAAVADLVVCGPGASRPSNSHRDVDVGDLVMNAGRPVLVAPHGCDALGTGPAVIAWKNTREARRALIDALPFLKRAESVTLLHVSEGESNDPSLTDAHALLTRHGIETAVRAAPKRHAPGREVMEFAASEGADLMVSGAFGHSRAREWAFGGVTRDLLARCPVPCLFSR